MYQCYYIAIDGNQCENRQEEHWCSQEHQEAWQAKNYPSVTTRGTKKLTIPEMQKRLLEMGAKKGGTKQLGIEQRI